MNNIVIQFSSLMSYSELKALWWPPPHWSGRSSGLSAGGLLKTLWFIPIDDNTYIFKLDHFDTLAASSVISFFPHFCWSSSRTWRLFFFMYVDWNWLCKVWQPLMDPISLYSLNCILYCSLVYVWTDQGSTRREREGGEEKKRRPDTTEIMGGVLQSWRGLYHPSYT